MRKHVNPDAMPDELMLAIGLIWGHLNTLQFEQADQLVRGCLRIWPEDKRLMLMAAYAAVELSRPLDAKALAVLRSADCTEWSELVLRRAESTAGAPPKSIH